jgi:GR25 family glycosyltransferase involved in LPS biosynthesis
MIQICFVILILVVIYIYVVSNKNINHQELFDPTSNVSSIPNEIDAFIYINLDNREDRKKLILEEFKKLNIPEEKIHRIAAVRKPKNGHKGCVQSHILALKLAKLNNWNKIAIFEDDMELNVTPEEFYKKINKALKYNKWDMLVLHGSYQEMKEDIDSDMYYLKNSTQSTGYVIKHNYIDTLMNAFMKCNNHMSDDKWGNGKHEPYALDQQWNELIRKDKWIGFKPNLITQRNSASSINEGVLY